MKRLILFAVGLMSSAAFAHQSCQGALFGKTFFSQLHHPSEALYALDLQAQPRYADALKDAKLLADRNFLLSLARQYALPERLAKDDLNRDFIYQNQFYNVDYLGGTVELWDDDGHLLLRWEKFPQLMSLKREKRQVFSASEPELLEKIDLRGGDRALAVFLAYLRSDLLDQVENEVLDTEVRDRALFVHWLDAEIAKAEGPAGSAHSHP